MIKSEPRTLARKRRHNRLRKRVLGTASRPRLCVFRSLKYISAQIVDDSLGHTLVAAGTLDPELRDKITEKTKSQEAELVGELIGQRALEKGISQVVFDRGGYKYEGRVKVLAQGARKVGLKF